MWFDILRPWREVRTGWVVPPRSAQRVVRREVFRPALEGLESRWCPALTLTQAGLDRGLSLSTFITDFPFGPYGGPRGAAFPSDGSVLVSDYSGDVHRVPVDTDGQSVNDVPRVQNYGSGDAQYMVQSGDTIYMTEAVSGRLVQLNSDGTFDQFITNVPRAAGAALNPANGHVFVATQGSPGIEEVDPVAHTARVFVANGVTIDGLTLSHDGTVLYGADAVGSRIVGFDVTDAHMVFNSGFIPGTVDGVAEGQGQLAGNLYVNTNAGTVVEVSLADPQQQVVVADNGSRGDFVTIDPHDGSALVTQIDRILRLTFPFGAVQRLAVGGFPSPSTAGTPGRITVTALDQNGQVATDYTGTVHFTSTDSQAGLPTDYTFTAADNGIHTFPGVTLGTAGSQAITVTDTIDSRLTATQSGILVTPAAASSLLTTGYPSPTVAGQVHAFTVTAQDAYGNTATDYTGTVHLTSSDPQAFLEGDYTFTVADHGSHPFGAILKTAGIQTLTATDINSGSITGTEDNIIVTPAPAVSFALSAPASVPSGTPFDVTVIALDLYGNTDVNYQGAVTFSTSDPDPGIVLPADYTFQPTDAGQVTFPGGVTLITPGDQTLTVMDTADNTITGSAVITVDSTTPGTGSHGLSQPLQPGRSSGSAPPASEPSHRQRVAVDRWFASLNKRNVGFVLAPPIRHARAGADWWALDSLWGDEPLLT